MTMSSDPFICGACAQDNHTHHRSADNQCLMMSEPEARSMGGTAIGQRACGCTKTFQPPHNVMHTNTSPLYFPREVVAHILEIAQGGRDGTVQLDFGGGKLKAWKLTMAGRDRDGVDPARPPNAMQL